MSLWPLLDIGQILAEDWENIVVNNERVTGTLTVNNEIINGNLTVNGTLTTNDELVNNDLTVSGTIYYNNLSPPIPTPAPPGQTVTIFPQTTNTFDIGQNLNRYNNLFLNQEASFEHFKWNNYLLEFIRVERTMNLTPATATIDITNYSLIDGLLPGFNLVTGVFTAPTNGIYFMNVNIQANNGVAANTDITLLFRDSVGTVLFGTTTRMNTDLVPNYAFLGNAQIMQASVSTVKFSVRVDTAPLNGVKFTFKILRLCYI